MKPLSEEELKTLEKKICTEPCKQCESEQSLLSTIHLLRSRLAIAVEALEELKLNHEHQPNLPHTRAMGDTYGWCDHCHTKVTWGGDDPAREALEKIGSNVVDNLTSELRDDE